MAPRWRRASSWWLNLEKVSVLQQAPLRNRKTSSSASTIISLSSSHQRMLWRSNIQSVQQTWTDRGHGMPQKGQIFILLTSTTTILNSSEISLRKEEMDFMRRSTEPSEPVLRRVVMASVAMERFTSWIRFSRSRLQAVTALGCAIATLLRVRTAANLCTEG